MTEGPISQAQEGGPMATLNTNQPPVLRKAVYAQVADLTSPYNIDQKQLEEELVRAKEESEKPVYMSLGVPAELETNVSQKRLQVPRGGYNLCVLVGKVDIVVDKSRVDGSRVRLAEVQVGDETGTVSLRARDEQIDILQQVSNNSGAVVLRNCTLELYQGKHIRLAVTKWGKINVYPDQIESTPSPPSKINKERDFSLINLGRVATVSCFGRQPGGYVDPEGRQPQQQSHQQSQGGRTQPYSQNISQSRRGNRRSSRGGKSSQSSMQAPQPHYSDRYPGGLHGYGTGFVDNRGVDLQQYPYNLRQQERQPYMMMQNPYDMQQMYQSSQDNSGGSPMLMGGLQNAPSFDGSSVGPEGPMTMFGTNPFMQHSQYPPSQMQQPHEPRSHDSTPPTTPQMEPQTPRMNPQAATFDPATSTPPES